MDVASVSGIAGQTLRGFFFKGWLRNEARDPVLLILVLAPWWDFRQKLESFQNQTASTFESLQNQTASTFEKRSFKNWTHSARSWTSEEGPARKDQRAAEARAAARKQRGRTKAEARAVDPVHPNPNPKP